MADEIKATRAVQMLSTQIPAINLQSKQFAIDQTNSGVYSNTLSIGTSEENIDIGTIFPDLTTAGVIYLENLDGTNYVDWGVSATTPTLAKVGRLGPSSGAGRLPWALFDMGQGSITLRAQANTAACLVFIMVWEV